MVYRRDSQSLLTLLLIFLGHLFKLKSDLEACSLSFSTILLVFRSTPSSTAIDTELFLFRFLGQRMTSVDFDRYAAFLFSSPRRHPIKSLALRSRATSAVDFSPPLSNGRSFARGFVSRVAMVVWAKSR